MTDTDCDQTYSQRLDAERGVCERRHDPRAGPGRHLHAHRICCNFVRLGRERGIKSVAMTGVLLDEVARVTREPEPHLTDEQVRACMSLEHFFDKHAGQGDPHPDETRRLIAIRRARLDALRRAQGQRRQQLADADARLWAAVDAIVRETHASR